VIWLIGDKGMLGSEVAQRLDETRLSWVGSDRDIDITDIRALRAFSEGKSIDWIVNCAAYTAVDKAEDEPVLCAALNCEGPAHIGALASEIGAAVMHISTDYVFDGTGNRPYREDDPVSPLGVYGATKAQGETALREACARSCILRTAWLYGQHGKNFVSTILRLMEERSEISVVADQRGTPTNAADLANALVTILKSKNIVYGTYHYANSGETTWYEFACAIHDAGRRAGILERDCNIRPLTTEQYPAKVRRPAYSTLSKDKIRRVFGIVPPPWRESLERYIIEMQRVLNT
jgi:dTDP-4-dehydrorhamnose reductase